MTQQWDTSVANEDKPNEKSRAIRARQRAIGRELRRMYDNVAQEPVPDDFLDLLQKIDAGARDGEKVVMPASSPAPRMPKSPENPDFKSELMALVPFLRAFARSLTGNPEAADDLAQETLVKAWQSRTSFIPGTNLKAWLFTILRNQFYSERRRAWRHAPWDQEAAERIPGGGDAQVFPPNFPTRCGRCASSPTNSVKR